MKSIIKGENKAHNIMLGNIYLYPCQLPFSKTLRWIGAQNISSGEKIGGLSIYTGEY